MITRDQLIVIGRFNKPHGVAGEIAATVDVHIDRLREMSCLICDMDGIFTPFFIVSARPKSATTVLLTIDGIDSEQQAATLVNHDIHVLKSDYSRHDDDQDDDFPLDFFIGFELRDSDGTAIGEISGVNEQTDNALFLVESDGQDIMVPVSDELVVEFDTDNKLIVMDLPTGLLELNQ